jgi:hypothetical protein
VNSPGAYGCLTTMAIAAAPEDEGDFFYANRSGAIQAGSGTSSVSSNSTTCTRMGFRPFGLMFESPPREGKFLQNGGSGNAGLGGTATGLCGVFNNVQDDFGVRSTRFRGRFDDF